MVRRRIIWNDKNDDSKLPIKSHLSSQSNFIESDLLKNNLASTSHKHNDNKKNELTSEENKHDDLAFELLRLTSTMKQNFTIAGTVIKEDNQVC